MTVDQFLSGNYRHDPHYPVGVSSRDFIERELEVDRDDDQDTGPTIPRVRLTPTGAAPESLDEVIGDIDLRVEDEFGNEGAEYEEGAA